MHMRCGTARALHMLCTCTCTHARLVHTVAGARASTTGRWWTVSTTQRGRSTWLWWPSWLKHTLHFLAGSGRAGRPRLNSWPATHAPRHPPFLAGHPRPKTPSLTRVRTAALCTPRAELGPRGPPQCRPGGLLGALLGAAHSRWLRTPGAALCEHPRRHRSACGSSRHMVPSRTGEQPSDAVTFRPRPPTPAPAPAVCPSPPPP